MIKKIYSAVDAEEVQAILDKGLTVKGYFGSSLHRVIDQDENDYLTQEVVEVNETQEEKRFRRDDGTSHALFGLVEVVMNKLERATNVWLVHIYRENARAQDRVLSMNRKYSKLDWGEYAVLITDRYVLVHAGYDGAGVVAHFERQGVRTQDTQPYTVLQWERERCMQVFLAQDFCVMYYEEEGLL